MVYVSPFFTFSQYFVCTINPQSDFINGSRTKNGPSLSDVSDEIFLCPNISRVFVHDAGVFGKFAVFCRLLSVGWSIFLLRCVSPLCELLGDMALCKEKTKQKSEPNQWTCCGALEFVTRYNYHITFSWMNVNRICKLELDRLEAVEPAVSERSLDEV